MNRRDFVLSGGALVAAAGGAGGVALHGPWVAAPVAANRVDKLLVDDRFAASRALAAEFPASVVGAVGAAGDVTRVWFDDLAHRWKAREVLLAGMTTPATLFCLEQLAKDHWKRVLLRIEHRDMGSRGTQHRITASAAATAAAPDLFRAAGPWPRATARLLRDCRPGGRDPLATHTFETPAPQPGAGTADVLVSWVIA